MSNCDGQSLWVTCRRSQTLVLSAVILASCSTLEGGERKLVELRSPGTLSDDGRTVTVGVESCNGRPTVEVTESAAAVIVRVTSFVPNGDQDGCQDAVTIVMQQPLGGRAFVDGSTDAEIDLSAGR